MRIEPADQLVDGERVEGLAAALGRVAEGFPESVGVDTQAHRGVAVEDEAHIGIFDAVRGDIFVREVRTGSEARLETDGVIGSGNGFRVRG